MKPMAVVVGWGRGKVQELNATKEGNSVERKKKTCSITKN